MVIMLISGQKRKRCGIRDGCKASECGNCRYCLDKKKYGGKGVLRQCCVSRRCKQLKVDNCVGTEPHIEKKNKNLLEEDRVHELLIN